MPSYQVLMLTWYLRRPSPPSGAYGLDALDVRSLTLGGLKAHVWFGSRSSTRDMYKGWLIACPRLAMQGCKAIREHVVVHCSASRLLLIHILFLLCVEFAA
jgi:hypothetical protein